MTTTTETATGLAVELPRTELAAALNTVSPAIPRRPPIPLLGGTLLHGDPDGTLSVTAFDYETAITMQINNVMTTPGQILVDHDEVSKMLPALLKGVRKRDADAMQVGLRSEADTVLVELNDHTMPVTTYPDADYPTVPVPPEAPVELDLATFTSEAKRVLTAACTDEVLPALASLYLEFTASGVKMAASDNYRLAVAELPATTPPELIGRHVLIPRAAIAAIVPRLTGDRIHLGVSETDQVVLSTDTTTVLMRTVDAMYPPIEKLFPNGETAAAQVDRAALTSATQRATAVLAAKKQKEGDVAITIDPEGGGVTVLPEVSNAHQITAPANPAEVTGLDDAMTVRVDPKFLADALGSLESDEITVQVTTPARPVLFTGTADPGYRHLVMTKRPR